MNRDQTPVSSESYFISEEETVKEEQVEVACAHCHDGVYCDADESYLEDQKEKHTRCTEARTLIDNSCLSVNTLFADQDKSLFQSAPEKGDFQVYPDGEESTGKEETFVHELTSSLESGVTGSDVTELGSVHIVGDLCLGAPIKKSSSENRFMALEHTHLPDCCRSNRSDEEHLADHRGLSNFEHLKAQLLDSGTSDASQGSSDCKLCGRSFSLQETFRIHQLLHRLDSVCSCAVCGRGLETDRPSGWDLCQCNDCGKNFVQQRSLKEHQHLHSVC